MNQKLKTRTLWILVICLLMTGCSGAPTSSAAANAAPASDAAASQAGGLSEPIAELPALIVSAGQSADFEMIKVMFDQNQMAYTAAALASKEDFGDNKTLVVAIGGSSKGLGAAGIDADVELERVKKLLAAAKENKMTIIAAHIGGDGRRGKLGDRYIEPCVLAADYVIVVESGNADGLFTKLTSENHIPMDVISNMTDAVPLVAAAFK
ncbi:MAG: DUF6305 family protein [Oscillospiraceae bacterium]